MIERLSCGGHGRMKLETSRTYLAVDLGASSGRVVAGRFDGRQLRLDEVHRFANGPTAAGGQLYWDLLGLWTQIQDGLRVAGEKYGAAVTSIGIDTWGVDFGLLGRNDELLGNPRHYRDPQHSGDGRAGVADGQSRGDLCRDRPAVHGAEHALPAAGDAAIRIRPCWKRRRRFC